MSGISTHVLDTASGSPAGGVDVTLERRDAGGGWTAVGGGRTDADGRAGALLAEGSALEAGTYRITFAIGPYHGRQGRRGFHPEVPVVFEVTDAAAHHHVPLLVSPFGYTTYRGS